MVDTGNNMIFEDEDSILFAEEESEYENEPREKWKIMIVDDEEEVHNVTRMVLSDFKYDGRTLQFISAYSGKEARKLIAENPDTAVMLLDVVMEEDNAGLKVVKHIRDELKNSLVRIILRTGQPGQAPEEKVIVDYDINDYKEKTELTSRKLFTAMVAALRSHRDLTIIDVNRRGLEKIIESSASIFELQSMKEFASAVLSQLIAILHLNKNALYCKTSSFAATRSKEEFYIMAATGDYCMDVDKKVNEVVTPEIIENFEKALAEKKSVYFDDQFIIYFKTTSGSENLIYLKGIRTLNDWDKNLIEIFASNVSIAFDNIYLNREVEDTQREIIFTLGEIAEARSHETGFHVKRVAEYSSLLASKYGLPPKDSELLKLAAPMHDVGKLAVPDAILNKPGKLDPDEFNIIKTHSSVGYEMLKKSSRMLMNASAIIALQHHEKYNGKGYPLGLRGEKIHIYARIVALADVFDALGSDRVYKKAWPLEDILELFKKERGEHFDPKLVDIFFENLDEFIRIRDELADR